MPAACRRDAAGLGADFTEEGAIGDPEALASLDNPAWQAAQQRLRGLLARRREQLGVVRQRLQEVDDAHGKYRQAEEQRDARADEFEYAPPAASQRMLASSASNNCGRRSQRWRWTLWPNGS